MADEETQDDELELDLEAEQSEEQPERPEGDEPEQPEPEEAAEIEQPIAAQEQAVE